MTQKCLGLYETEAYWKHRSQPVSFWFGRASPQIRQELEVITGKWRWVTWARFPGQQYCLIYDQEACDKFLDDSHIFGDLVLSSQLMLRLQIQIVPDSCTSMYFDLNVPIPPITRKGKQKGPVFLASQLEEMESRIDLLIHCPCLACQSSFVSDSFQ